MAVTIKQAEAAPATWPAAPLGLSTAAAAIPAAVIWGRIEGWLAHRWTARTVVWTVEGPGEWVPPLAPATVTATDLWQADAWAAVTLRPSPLGGFILDGAGPYRVTATVGAGTPPAAVLEAYTRLAEYLAGARDSTDEPGASVSKFSIGGGGNYSVEVTRNPAWVARAMHYSGAADLLRPWRMA